MSKSISFVTSLGGKLHPNTSQLATLYCTKEVSLAIKETLTATSIHNHAYEWTMEDGSMITLWDAGLYSKLPWYFMAYDCSESDAIRYRRANPTPDTSHE